MLITCIYLLICWLSQDISVNIDIFVPLIIVEGIVDVAYYIFRKD